MSRDRRITVFVNDEEYGVLRSVVPDDESLGKTVRRLALKRAEWLCERGFKQRGNLPSGDVPWVGQSDGELVLDRSDSQV